MAKINEVKWEDVKVGDGVTVRYWSDAHAGTVIARTARSLTIQRDKATLSPDFIPEFIPGGFCGTVVNQNEQTYSYEPDPKGCIYKAFWSEKKRGFYADKCLRICKGRHEFYDYNF